MDTRQFEQELERDGYTERLVREMQPNVVLDMHTHPFDVRAMVLEGQLTLTWNGASKTFRAGDVFTMDAGCEHKEEWGPQGTRYFVGRRHRQG